MAAGAPDVGGVRGMLVAAGFGTRLGSLTDELPKPAVPVANRPVGAYSLAHMARAGLRDIAINTHHLPDALEAALRPWADAEVRLRFVHEPRILGTGGGVKNAWAGAPDAPLLIVNGKLLFEPDLARLMTAHRERGALATLVLAPMPPGDPFAPVDIDAEGWVRALREPVLKPGLRRCMFTGVRLLDPRARSMLPDDGCFVADGLIPWLAQGHPVAAVLDEQPFCDVGRSPEAYFAANLDVLTGRRRLHGVAPDPATRSVVDPAARVASGCALAECAIGAGVRVEAERLTRVVAWPGATIEGELSDAVVTGAGRVLRFPPPP